ncbi:MAG TPA: carboxypeptidase regulatory-like domain-containing protein [Candidatus Koribacter sp.]|jgi:hypothetical protein
MLILFVVILTACSVFAQFDVGTINGTVTDTSGAAVSNAKVTITNEQTGVTKTVTTNGTGFYIGSALQFGNYVVSATAQGFGESKTKTIVLNVGAVVQANLALNVAGGQTNVDVTGTNTSVNTESPAAGTTLNATQIANLPVNGRDVSDFLEIAPGSVDSTGFFQGSVNGMENIFTGLNVTVDGQNASRGDINGFLDTEGQELARITRASVDSIQEIDFTNSGFGADSGRSLGPQMNIITKSGTNDFHGTLFEFFRNQSLDARDYFNTGEKSPLRLNQFGGNLGGPIIKNKLFFFINYEGDRTHITNLNALYEIPSQIVRTNMALTPALAPILAQFAPLSAGCTGTPAPASCAVPKTTDANPANGADLVYDPAALPDILREDTGSIKVDWNITDRDRIFFRYNINDSLTNYTYGLNQGQTSPQAMRTQLGKIDETHTFSPTLLNQFSVALNRFYSNTNSDTPSPLVAFTGFFTNLGALPGPNTFNQITPFNTFEIFDNVTKTAGSHTLKFGVQYRANQLNEWLRPQQTYSFGSFSDLENNNPFVLQKIGFPGFVGVQNNNIDFYAQDDWHASRKLTINLGLRYEFNTVWNERHNNEQNFDIATQSFLPTSQDAYNAPKNDFAPRIGFSYDPFGTGKTVIHGYGGLFYMPMQFGFGLISNIPDLSSYNVNVFQAIFNNPPFSISYPSPNPPLIAGTQNVSIFPTNAKDPVSTNWLFGIQQEIAPNTVLDLKYVGNHAVHMQAGVDFAAVNVNAANFITQAGRPYSGFANENYDCDCLSSSYNSLQAQVRHNVGRLNYEVNYTWSHEIDDMVNVFSGFSNPMNPNYDRGNGDWDVRHNLTGSLVYGLPELKGSNGFVRNVLGGWQVSSILQARSGLPVNVTLVPGFFGVPVRPDSVAGQIQENSNGNWAYPNSVLNLSGFTVPADFTGAVGQDGNVGRNTFIGPKFVQIDFSLMKDFAITEGFKLEFRADIFNILNHPNFQGPGNAGICANGVAAATATTPATCSIDLNTGLPALNPNFAQVSQTVADANTNQIGPGTARQVQFSAKIIF